MVRGHIELHCYLPESQHAAFLSRERVSCRVSSLPHLATDWLGQGTQIFGRIAVSCVCSLATGIMKVPTAGGTAFLSVCVDCTPALAWEPALDQVMFSLFGQLGVLL